MTIYTVFILSRFYSIMLLLWHLVMLNVSILLWLPSPFECVEHSFFQNWCYVSFITVNVTKHICMHLHAHTHKHTMHTYVPTHTYTYTEREGEGEIFKNWLTWLWSLASLKFVGQARRLETQPVFDAAVLRQNFSSGKTLYLFLRPSPDWMRPTYITEVSLLYLKSTD